MLITDNFKLTYETPIKIFKITTSRLKADTK